MIFDVAFHPATVDLLINEGGLTACMDFGRAEMAVQIIPCYRQTITGHLHRRIRSQTIAIVRILIAQGDLIDPLTPKITEAMIHITLMPIIRYTVTKTLNQPYGLVHRSRLTLFYWKYLQNEGTSRYLYPWQFPSD